MSRKRLPHYSQFGSFDATRPLLTNSVRVRRKVVDFSLFRRHNNCYSGAVLFFKERWGLEDDGVQRVESCVSKYYFVCDLLGKI